MAESGKPSGLAALMAQRKAATATQADAPPAPAVVTAPEPAKETPSVKPVLAGRNAFGSLFGGVAKSPPAPPKDAPVKSLTERLHPVAQSVLPGAEAESEAQAVELGSIDSLADLEALEDMGTAPGDGKREAESEYLRSRMSQFDDETPATKPSRELPEGIESQQLQFVEMMDGVYDLLDDPELLGMVIKNIMIELKANPQYINMVTKDDVRQWVRTMRHTMGLARIKKMESKEKRGKGTTRAKPSSKLLDQDVLNAASGIDWDNV